MKKVKVIGTVFGTSGYDIHTRSLFNALFEKAECSLQTSLIPNWQRFCKDNELIALKRKNEGAANLIITNPVNWRVNLNKNQNIVYCVWEGSKVPKFFIDEILNPRISKVIVPSKHTEQAILNAVSTTNENINAATGSEFRNWDIPLEQVQPLIEKIEIVNHGVDTSLFYPTERANDGVFRFFANKGFTNIEDRGGIQYVLKAYFEEFKLSDNVELFIKINPAYGVPDLQKIVNELAPAERQDLPKVVFAADNIAYEKMNELYNKCDVFVSPARAEAFNIPVLEAMACGKPVIVSSFGGQTDFVDDSVGWIIGGELEEVKHDLMYEGCKWLTPDIKQLRAAMRDSFEHKDKCETKGKNAVEVAKNMSWHNTAEKILKLIK